MSAFSDTLSQFIDDKKIKVYSMAKYCDTDRSTMYKFISGKRNPPSDEIIKKMAQFMHLSPMEWQKFKESWILLSQMMLAVGMSQAPYMTLPSETTVS